MHITIEENRPVIKDLPKGNEILFFAKIDERRGYCVIFRPHVEKSKLELFDASVAHGNVEGGEMEVHKVQHGHKYDQGGGFVEFGAVNHADRKQIFFRLPGDDKKSSYEGMPIKEVYIAL